jgi:hypothetical protein
MKRTYYYDLPIRCRVPAPPVGFVEGGRVVFAGQFLGKGTSKGDETRRGRKAARDAGRPAGECRMQNAKCKRASLFHFAFCILHSALGGRWPCPA